MRVGNVNESGGLCGCCNIWPEDTNLVGNIFDDPEVLALYLKENS